MKIECVMDTNVLISGILWRGVPFQLLKLAEQEKLIIFSSMDILTEVYRVLHYPKFQRYIEHREISPRELFDKIESLCTIVHVEQKVSGVCSDPDDEKFLACALAADVKFLVSGDNHLLDMKEYQSVSILSARTFYEEINTHDQQT